MLCRFPFFFFFKLWQPLSSYELDELEASLNVGEIATYIQLPELRFFSQIVDNLANLAKSLHIVVSKDRRLFLTALDSSIQIGAEFKQLEVVGETGMRENFTAN